MFPFHHEFLHFLKVIVRPSTYLEIGVATGKTLFAEPRADLVIGVDPGLHINEPMNFTWHAALFKETSDTFFDGEKIKTVTDKPVDLTFVDGLHLCEFVLRDIRNTERVSHAESVIAVHDIYPRTAKEASRQDNLEGNWMGDVFKATHALRKFRPYLKVALISDIPPSGMAVIYGLDPTNRTLFERYDEVVEYMNSLDYDRDFRAEVLPTFISVSSDEFSILIRDLFACREKRDQV